MTVLTVCTTAFAGSVKVVSGKSELKSISSMNVQVSVSFNWNGTTYDWETDLRDELEEDYGFVLDDCARKFIEGYNETSKGPGISEPSGETRYEYVVTVKNVDKYFNVAKIRYSGKVWGTIELFSKDSGEKIAEIEIDAAHYSADMYKRECYGKTFLKLGQIVGKF